MGFTYTFEKHIQNKTIPRCVLMCYNLQLISRGKQEAEASISELFQLRFEAEKICVYRQLRGQEEHKETQVWAVTMSKESSVPVTAMLGTITPYIPHGEFIP